MSDIENTETTINLDSNLSVDCAVGNTEDSEIEKPILTILYQDEYMVAVDKPAGLFVHRSFMDKDEIYFALQLVRDQIGQYVYPVHRLDRPTSGVLLFALTKEVATLLSEAFANKSSKAALQADSELSFKLAEQSKAENATTFQNDESCDLAMVKTYYALVRGYLAVEVADKVPSSAAEGNTDLVRGFIDHPLKEKLDKLGDKNVSRDKPAQSAQSYYRVLEQASLPIRVGKFDSVRYSLVEVQPITGRRHQIRRHLAHLRHPIIGDINYGDNKQNPFFISHFGYKRLMLIAKSLEFNHPITNKRMKISAPFDDQWQQVFTELQWPIR